MQPLVCIIFIALFYHCVCALEFYQKYVGPLAAPWFLLYRQQQTAGTLDILFDEI